MILIAVDHYDDTDYLYPPAYVSESAKNLRICGAVLIPSLWMLSYLLLLLFYKWDKGFFSLARIQFFYNNNNDKG